MLEHWGRACFVVSLVIMGGVVVCGLYHLLYQVSQDMNEVVSSSVRMLSSNDWINECYCPPWVKLLPFFMDMVLLTDKLDGPCGIVAGPTSSIPGRCRPGRCPYEPNGAHPRRHPCRFALLTGQ